MELSEITFGADELAGNVVGDWFGGWLAADYCFRYAQMAFCGTNGWFLACGLARIAKLGRHEQRLGGTGA